MMINPARSARHEISNPMRLKKICHELKHAQRDSDQLRVTNFPFCIPILYISCLNQNISAAPLNGLLYSFFINSLSTFEHNHRQYRKFISLGKIKNTEIKSTINYHVKRHYWNYISFESFDFRKRNPANATISSRPEEK
jgi:hypothetical protein